MWYGAQLMRVLMMVSRTMMIGCTVSVALDVSRRQDPLIFICIISSDTPKSHRMMTTN